MEEKSYRLSERFSNLRYATIGGARWKIIQLKWDCAIGSHAPDGPHISISNISPVYYQFVYGDLTKAAGE